MIFRISTQQLNTQLQAMQQMEIWLVILSLSRKKFHVQQIFVLSSFIKLGPVFSSGKIERAEDHSGRQTFKP